MLVPESESQLCRTKAAAAAGPHELPWQIPMHICVTMHMCMYVLVSACLHVCVELKKYDILSVKQALCQTNSHWLSYKRGIATLSCLPATPISLQSLQSLPHLRPHRHARIGI